MARASRSNKKQPAFDPSELQDLIFSPAVGSGVGSHLLGSADEFPAPTKSLQEVEIPPTVDMSVTSPVPTTECTTVDTIQTNITPGMRSAASLLDRLQAFTNVRKDAQLDLSTVDTRLPSPDISGRQNESRVTIMSTVAESSGTTVARPDLSIVKITDSNGAIPILHTADKPPRPNGEEGFLDSVANVGDVVASEPSVIRAEIKQRPLKEVVLWITEQGDLVPQARVKRIRLAQDVINSAEESVYDTLWAAKSQNDERESTRVVQAGYDYLVKRTRLSKKTIQRIIAKLISKDFIAIERHADIYQRTSTVYRVFSYKAVLDRHLQRGRSHVAKMGPGFSYVQPMEDPRQSLVKPNPPDISSTANPIGLSTVDMSNRPTVLSTVQTTAANQSTDTVARSDMSTVVRATTTSIGKDVLDNVTSSSSNIYKALSEYGAVDDDIVDRLLRSCKQNAPDCTEEEIVHFIEEKGSLVRVRDSRIYSPVGFLLTAVPKCLSGEAFRFYREEQTNRRNEEAAYEARRQAELDEWRREQEARLADPNVSEKDKLFIRKYFGGQ